MRLDNILARFASRQRQGQYATATQLPSTRKAASPPGSSAKIHNWGLVRGMILLAEDNHALREVVAHALTDEGYAVFPAEDENHAISIAENIAYPDLDLILTDIVMPVMGGIELADRVKAIHPEARIILMSAYADAEKYNIRKRLKTGDVSFIPKPFSLDALTELVEGNLGK